MHPPDATGELCVTAMVADALFSQAQPSQQRPSRTPGCDAGSEGRSARRARCV